jgi:hypothetical protein
MGIGQRQIAVEVLFGTLEEARWDSFSANAWRVSICPECKREISDEAGEHRRLVAGLLRFFW